MSRPRSLNEQVVVITGASSGIGRETALQFARRGAAVVVAARNEAALNTLVEEIAASGGVAHAIVCDVANWDDVQRLAEHSNALFGRVDTWFNNAGVGIYGTIEDLTIEEIEQVIRIDLFGTIYGTKAILPYLRQQGHGTIINMGSVESWRAVPLHGPYAAAKHGIKGFTEALRMELDYEDSGINVTLIMPASINTPFFDNARTKLGVKGAPIPPVYQPRAVAEAVVAAAESPQRDVFVGVVGKLMQLQDVLAPSLLDKQMVAGGALFRVQRSDIPDDGRDNLFSPSPYAGVAESHWNTLTQPTSLYTRFVELRPNQQRLLVGAAILGAALWLRSRQTSQQRHDHDSYRGTFDGYPEAPPPYPSPIPVSDTDGGYYTSEYVPAT